MAKDVIRDLIDKHIDPEAIDHIVSTSNYYKDKDTANYFNNLYDVLLSESNKEYKKLLDQFPPEIARVKADFSVVPDFKDILSDINIASSPAGEYSDEPKEINPFTTYIIKNNKGRYKLYYDYQNCSGWDKYQSKYIFWRNQVIYLTCLESNIQVQLEDYVNLSEYEWIRVLFLENPQTHKSGFFNTKRFLHMVYNLAIGYHPDVKGLESPILGMEEENRPNAERQRWRFKAHRGGLTRLEAYWGYTGGIMPLEDDKHRMFWMRPELLARVLKDSRCPASVRDRLCLDHSIYSISDKKMLKAALEEYN